MKKKKKAKKKKIYEYDIEIPFPYCEVYRVLGTSKKQVLKDFDPSTATCIGEIASRRKKITRRKEHTK